MLEFNIWDYEFEGFKNIPSYCNELLEKYENYLKDNPEEKDILSYIIDNIKYYKNTFIEMFEEDLKNF